MRIVGILAILILFPLSLFSVTSASTYADSSENIYTLSAGERHPPIVISKLDPWTPLRNPDDGVKPCLEGGLGQMGDSAYAWIELQNISNKTLTISGQFGPILGFPITLV